MVRRKNNAQKIRGVASEKGDPKCPICGVILPSDDAVAIHLAKAHPESLYIKEVGDAVSSLRASEYSEEYLLRWAAYTGRTVEEVKADLAKKPPEKFEVEQLEAELTPENAYAKAKTSADEAEDKYKVMVTGAIAMEAIPMIDTGMATLRFMDSPVWGAGNRMATDFRYSSYKYGTDPLIRRYWLKRRLPMLPGVRDLVDMKSKHIIEADKYIPAMHESGFPDEWADLLAEAPRVFPGVEAALTLLRRGEIDDDTFWLYLTRNRFGSEEIDKIKTLRAVIPPIQDLRLMAVREAFPVEPGPPQYAEMEKWAVKMGLDPYWTMRYYYMGFTRMDVRDAVRYFLWYHDLPEDYESWLRIADIHPDDRPRVREVGYTPPGIRELGYGYDMGVYDRSDIISARRRAGRSPADAIKCADALIAYRIFAEAEAVRREWLHLVSMGRKTLSEFEAKLVEMKTSPEAIPLWIERAELEAERRLKPETDVEGRIVTSSEALWAFEYDLKPEDWLRAHLKELDWTDERIGLAVERAVKRKEMRVKPPKEVSYRSLTTTQIHDLYLRKKIPPEELPATFEGIGYSPEDAVELARIMLEIDAEEAAREEEKLLKAQERDRDSLIKFVTGRLRDENLRLYQEGFREKSQTRANFGAMGVEPDITEVYVAEAGLRAELDYKLELVRLYRDAFKKVPFTDAQFIAALLSIPMREDRVQLEYLKAKVSLRPDVPLPTLIAQYPGLLEEAHRLMEGWAS